ncbi:MAG: tRNA uridine-5-carboxymethylaminomethyl(34) synthesis GTPase MnmE [Lachnospiraceae bacterium]|nr:tRNA uridine-5-carboxymethylaminomethyl(34) synthesis GTPase MnmE [Lachnospiraceae bacterium]
MRNHDTIAAIATGTTNAGISIIRISGADAFSVADAVFLSKKGKKRLSEQKSHTLHYGKIVDGDVMLDEVLVSVMRAPNTYTTEDVVEINCHGGMIVTKRILELVLSKGVRLAEPGEFTKRAFLNGRMDLSQAEAVIDLIHATNEQAVKNSVRQLNGNLYKKIKEIRESVLRDTAFIEAALDDPEHISLDGFTDTLQEHTEANLKEIKALLKNAEDGKIIKEGIRTVILGKPNAGKSTLMNVLVGEERAIVTDIPGTTRDTLEELIQVKGIVLRVIDTAGIRHTQDIVEKIGVERARTEAEGADFVIYVADASRELDENDEAVISMIQEKKAVVLLNKSDLSMKTTKEELEQKTGKQVFLISAKEETGMDAFAEAVEKMFYQGLIDQKEEVFITNLRHKQALADAKESLDKVLESLALDMPEDFYSIDLMNAYQVLGEIIGEAVDEDLVDKIFKDFCMGK